MSEYVVRFSVRQRIEHAVVMVLFLVLAITGLPQKFFDSGWSAGILQVLGGIHSVRWIHRTAGILFTVVAGVHFGTALAGIIAGRTPLSLVPTRKDFEDAVVTLRYYLGLESRSAEFDRFDYRQKFEYWGLVLGGVVMILTGFILYFPVAAASVLPAQLIPAAKVAHSNEGLLAFLVVITWHIYNAHLAPEVFPFDTAIFTGRISRERMEKDHSIEYARLQAAREAAQPRE